MKIRLYLSAFALVVLAMPLSAHAAGQGPRETCKSDAQSFCGDVQPGGGRILDCLKDHYKQLSDPCYQALQNSASRGGGQQGQDGAPPPPPSHSGTGSPPPNDFGKAQTWPPSKSHDGPPPPDDDNGGNDAPPPPGN